MKLNLKDAAIVVWMPTGAEPSLDSFEQANVQAPPSPNPEAWWELGPALASARMTSVPGKEPWIKVGSETLNPAQVIAAYDQYRAFSPFIEL